MQNRTTTSSIDDVRSYYQRNTRRFELFGQGRRTGSIHRAVWAEGVTSRERAFLHLDERILGEIDTLTPLPGEPLHVLDLGCGIGATLIFLASRARIRATGVTLSSEQARRARERVARVGLGDRITCLEADFLDLPAAIEPAHLAFSIEAFVHSPDPGAYFASAARRLVAGGLLVVCDDFLTDRAEGALTTAESSTLREVRDDWLASSLITPDHANDLAARAGFELRSNVDLTAYLELRRPRDLVVAAAAAIGRRIPSRGSRWRSWVGGDALQTALLSGLIQFRCMTWSYPTTG